MRKLLELIKDTPWGVTVAIVFLFTVFVTMFVMAPVATLIVGGLIGVVLSILRIGHYLTYGN
jgi:hypothetical protein